MAGVTRVGTATTTHPVSRRCREGFRGVYTLERIGPALRLSRFANVLRARWAISPLTGTGREDRVRSVEGRSDRHPGEHRRGHGLRGGRVVPERPDVVLRRDRVADAGVGDEEP